MNTDNGALNFDVDLNIEKLMAAIRDAEQRIKGFSNNIEDEGQKIDQTFSRLGKAVGAYLSYEALKGFASQLVSVRGEFQQLDVAFTTMLGSKEKADALMAQIVDTAAKTPYTLTEVATGAKQLLAYQVAAEDVNDTVIRLGNVASGVSVPLQQLIGAYGKVKASGQLMGDQLNMFIDAGVPLIHELAKNFGVADSEIKKMVESGKIGFPDVQNAIKNMTDEGGMFYNLMEKQSKTLTGQISNLQDAWDRMLNKIGENNEGFISDIISGATWVVGHYEEILNVLVPIIAAIGTYKAALLAMSLAQKAAAALTFAKEYIAMGRALGFATANQIAFNKASLANPYALAATVVIGLSYAIYKIASNLSAAEEAQKQLNDAMSEANKQIAEEKSKVNSLIPLIIDESNSREYRNQKLKDLIALSPENLQNLTLENIKTAEGKSIIDGYVKSLEKKIKLQTYEKELEESVKRKLNAENNSDNVKWYQKIISLFASTPQYGTQMIQRGSTYDDLKKEFSNKNNNEIFDAETKLQEEIKNKIKELTSDKNTGPDAADVIINADYWEKQVKEAKEALDKLDTRSSLFTKEQLRLQNIIANGEAEINRIRGSKKKEFSLEEFNRSKKEALELRQLMLNNEKDLLDLQQDGFDKEKAKIDLNHKQKLLDIDKQSLELLTKQQEEEKKKWDKSGKTGKFKPGTDLTPENKTVIDKMTDTANKQSKNQTDLLLKGLLDQYTGFNEKRLKIEKKYNDDASNISKSYKGQDIEIKLKELNRQKKEALDEIKRQEAESVEKDNEMLINLFERSGKMSKKTTTETIYNTEKLLKYLRSNETFSLTFITKDDADRLKNSPDEVERIQDAVDKLKSGINAGGEGYLFAGLVNGIKQLKLAEDNLKKAEEASTKVLKERYIAEAEYLKNNAIQNIIDASTQAIDTVNELASAMGELAEATNSEDLKEYSDQLKSMTSLAGSIANGAKNGGWIGAIVSGIGNVLTQTFNAFKEGKAEEQEAQQNRLNFLNKYQLLLLKVSDTTDKVFGINSMNNVIDAYHKAMSALEKYNEALNATGSAPDTKYLNSYGNPLGDVTNWVQTKTGLGAIDLFAQEDNRIKTLQEAYEKGYNDLQAMAVKTKDRSGWANFWGKQDEYTSLKDLAPEMWGSDGQFDTEAAKAFLETNTQINDEQKAQIQNAVDLKTAYDEAMDAVDSEIQNTFGSLYNDLSDALVNAVQNGTDAWTEFQSKGFDVLQNLGKKLMMELFFNEKFDNLKEQLRKAYKADDPTTLAEKQKEILNSFFNEIKGSMGNAEDFLANWNEQSNLYGFTSDNANTSLSGAIKGMSEETASVLSGYINAIRINQVESMQMLREQIVALNSIATNTGNLDKLGDILGELKNLGQDKLRAQGL